MPLLTYLTLGREGKGRGDSKGRTQHIGIFRKTNGFLEKQETNFTITFVYTGMSSVFRLLQVDKSPPKRDLV